MASPSLHCWWPARGVGGGRLRRGSWPRRVAAPPRSACSKQHSSPSAGSGGSASCRVQPTAPRPRQDWNRPQRGWGAGVRSGSGRCCALGAAAESGAAVPGVHSVITNANVFPARSLRIPAPWKRLGCYCVTRRGRGRLCLHGPLLAPAACGPRLPGPGPHWEHSHRAAQVGDWGGSGPRTLNVLTQRPVCPAFFISSRNTCPYKWRCWPFLAGSRGLCPPGGAECAIRRFPEFRRAAAGSSAVLALLSGAVAVSLRKWS